MSARKRKEEFGKNDLLALDEIRQYEGAKWVKKDDDGNWIVTSKTSNPRGGTHLTTYKDSMGLPTTGFGHRIFPGEKFPEYMTPEYAEELFRKDYLDHKEGASRGPGWNQASDRQKRGLTNLAFNMGVNWHKGWTDTPNAMNAGNWGEAAKLLQESKWFDDVGGNKYIADPSKASSRGPDVINLLTPVEEEPVRVAQNFAGGGIIRDIDGRRLI
jgi:GH24 family phage-related lysozyme (muramidase)